jgi:membrane associated rhomboid family serine protease
MPDDDLPPDDAPAGALADIGRYRRLASARERGLVIAAMDLPHWIERDGRHWVLRVEEAACERAAAAVAEFEMEERTRPRQPEIEQFRIPKFVVLLTLVVMALLYRLQIAAPAALAGRGVAANEAIGAGEWWRVFTALTLHGDAEHLVSNLGLGVFVFAFVFWRFGAGAGLLGIVLGGGLGNLLNAFAHAAKSHHSIGSSTALFAGLGLLTGGEFAARLMHRAMRTRWQLVVPLGAGLAFLALFGGGGANSDGTPALDAGRVDVMAHLFGLAAGILVGAVFFAAGMKAGAARVAQLVCGALAVAILAGAWLVAAGGARP